MIAIDQQALRTSRYIVYPRWLPHGKNFKTAMKEKRTGKKGGGTSNNILAKEEVVIQRLSAEVSGKAQKYSRIGPREFVPYEYEEVTLANIKSACKQHFSSKVGDEMICDILAGEQGPSCSSLDQIPDMKVVYIRFIEAQSHSFTVVTRKNEEVAKGLKRQRATSPNSEPSPRTKVPPVKWCPKVSQL